MTSRRAVLEAIGLLPLTAVVAGGEAAAADYESAAQVLAEIDRMTAEVEARLAALGARVPSARGLAASLRADHERFARDRRRLRTRLGVGAAEEPVAPELSDGDSLAALRTAQEALVHAYAEGLPAIRDPYSVDLMAAHLVELSRHLTVFELWLEAEEGKA